MFNPARVPLDLRVEIHDRATRDYWTRVNHATVIPPGRSSLILPLQQLYVGEKSRPGRPLLLEAITRLVFNIGKNPVAPLFFDSIRLERDRSVDAVRFDELFAFDFGSASSPIMPGFTRITAATRYSPGRGYGLQAPKIWRTHDALQPDPLYQDFLCIESGGIVVDVPNGQYRVFVNMDSPSGYWGDYAAYRRRAIIAQGRMVVIDEMDYTTFKKKYFRFWNIDDLPTDRTFDKYQGAYFDEKTFDVDVTDGRLRLEFEGRRWACSVSAVIIYPLARASAGARFLRWVKEKLCLACWMGCSRAAWPNGGRIALLARMVCLGNCRWSISSDSLRPPELSRSVRS